ncbi:integrase_H2C2 domain-containing protein [Trichonephila clavata]|uniref:Integrase_H2C2 domain-containing protein n=1 Tax=Trichonephila clavata TaxID=2740835 RepID=A0A8X6HZX4_TRICU|nr:integrase_H2C2 domain-containing protein [Trichonephila clavata]
MVVNMVTLTLQNMELPKIWDLEVLDIKDPVERKNKTFLEEETLIHFKETIKVRKDRRYEVSLPWLAGHPPVYDMILHGTFKQVTLHIFTDTSAIGYACCAFLQCEEEDEVKVSFVSAKARVAHVQRPTIPRLELLGAAIGARIASTILETLNSPLKTHFWTDSMTVLGWITNSEPWNTFVGNRVREIRELTNVEY